MKPLKHYHSVLMGVLLVIFSTTPVISQEKSNTQPLIKENVIKKNGVLQVKNFKAIDLSRYALKDQEKIDSLLSSLKIEEGGKPLEFDCGNAERTKPALLKNLNVIDDRFFEVSRNSDVKLSLFGISGERDKNDILVQANFWLFKDYDCPNGTATRALVGMTMYLRITNTKMKLSSLNLSNISAAVQLGKASANYHLQFFGVTEGIDFSNLPSAADLNVDNYSKVIGAWDNLKKSIKSDMKVDPVIVPNVLRVTASL